MLAQVLFGKSSSIVINAFNMLPKIGGVKRGSLHEPSKASLESVGHAFQDFLRLTALSNKTQQCYLGHFLKLARSDGRSLDAMASDAYLKSVKSLTPQKMG